MKKLLVITFALLFSGVFTASAQSSYEDFTYPHTAVKDRKAIPYRFIREANVKWSKRIHRVIDTREKQNKVMHWPRNPFYKVVWDFAQNGENQVYSSDSLDMGTALTWEDIIKMTSIETTIEVPDPDDPDYTVEQTITIDVKPEEIVKYRVMEDWIFDHTYSDFRARIIAIAPLFRPPTESGIELDEQPLFWIKMDDFRQSLANQEVFNQQNDAARLSFDHWFQMRMFSSYIVKESNKYDIDVKYFEEFRDDGIAALLESDRIKNDLFITEHDLWEY